MAAPRVVPPGPFQGLASKAGSRGPLPNNPPAGWYPHGMPAHPAGAASWVRPPPPPPPLEKMKLRAIVSSGEDLNNLPLNETLAREVQQHLEYFMSLHWPKAEPIFTATYEMSNEVSAPAADTVSDAAPTFTQNEPVQDNGPPQGSESGKHCPEAADQAMDTSSEQVSNEVSAPAEDTVSAPAPEFPQNEPPKEKAPQSASETEKDCPEAVDDAMDTSSESSADGAEAAELLEESEVPEAPAPEAVASASSSSTTAVTSVPVPAGAPGLASSAPPEVAGQTRKVPVKKSLILRPAWREGAQAATDLLLRRKLQKAKEGDKVDLMLRQIRYSQDSIMGFFRDKRTVAQMRRELCKGQKLVAQIPKISAVVHDGIVYSQDNRRLWTFKHCGMPENVRIPVLVGRKDDSFAKKLTTPSAGRTICKRGNEGWD
eukprot:TRINITY_DN25608_c0_g1_i1.p1 TRINITY_DN25608_c0_g1~~TRINITY_DN25608_c0_g1_i1.p1  ORF type:complete len:429 (+),score=91.40 TRINITY_DN25608_c0_g1_i1:49-1335(+)